MSCSPSRLENCARLWSHAEHLVAFVAGREATRELS